jgi:hypothetical protein
MRSADRRRAVLGAAAGVAVPAFAFGAWLVASSQAYHRGGGVTTAGLAQANQTHIGEQISYLWQTFFPRLPTMSLQFGGRHPIWDEYFKGFVGRFGYNQYSFPVWVDKLALLIAAVVLGLAGLALWRARARLRSRRLELACYVVFLGSIFVLVGVAGYHFRKSVGLPFEQARYLFPLLPLYAAVVALAVRGVGRRLAPAAAGALVALFVVHNFFSLLITMGRYYT